jgi:hypothetical protein
MSHEVQLRGHLRLDEGILENEVDEIENDNSGVKIEQIHLEM